MAVTCERGELIDVRFCLTRDLRAFARCPKVTRRSCREVRSASRRSGPMNYRHAFHAGNFADVVKHAILARILVYLARKDAPFRFIDTHAGAGRYDLAGAEARRSPEWRDGVARLLEASPPAPIAALLEPYLEAVGPLDAGGVPASYPGSPAIAQALLRAAGPDRALRGASGGAGALIAALGRDGRLSIVGTDGYVALNAYLPPKERRGLVLIDPPFEQPRRAGRVEQALARALRKWPTGIYLAWRPIREAARRRALSQQHRRARRAEHPQARARRRAGSGRRAGAAAAGARRAPRRQPAAHAGRRGARFSCPGSPRCLRATGRGRMSANG